MARTHKLENNPSVRLDPATFNRVEAVRSRLSSKWRDASLSEALRACIVRGLAAAEVDPACLLALKRQPKPKSS